MRSTPTQTCPALAQAAQTAAADARSRGASASTIIGCLPPSSRIAGLSWAAARAATALPVAVEPVKRTRSQASITRSPEAPPPAITVRRPSGRSPVEATAVSSHSAVLVVHSEGLSRTALPASIAAKASAKGMRNGRFHGQISPTTPRGMRRTLARLFKRNQGVLTARSSSRRGASEVKCLTSRPQVAISISSTSAAGFPVSSRTTATTSARRAASSRQTPRRAPTL